MRKIIKVRQLITARQLRQLGSNRLASQKAVSLHTASHMPRQLICFATNQHATEVEALSTNQISVIFRRASFPNFEISKFSDLQARKFENVEFRNAQ